MYDNDKQAGEFLKKYCSPTQIARLSETKALLDDRLPKEPPVQEDLSNMSSFLKKSC